MEEIAEADLLVHLVDITHPNAVEQWKSVKETLVKIGADHIPVITALNKIDHLADPQAARQALAEFSNSVAISALTGAGIPDLRSAIEAELFETMIPITVRLPYEEGQLISLFHEQGQVQKIEHGRGGVLLQGHIPGRLMARFQAYILKSRTRSKPAGK
jgi:GTP-binding protein HflX